MDTSKPKTTARDFFLYFGAIIGLYVSTVSFITLLFQLLNKTLPDTTMYYSDPSGAIRSALAALIIFFPAYLYISRVVNRDLAVFPEKKDLWIRRWLSYFTLFLAGLTIAIDLVTLVYSFLNAEDLTLRFVLKVLVVLVVAVSIFRYYLYDLRRDPKSFLKGAKIFMWSAVTIVLVSIVGGIISIPSPKTQRLMNLDNQRVSDLQTIQNQIVYNYWQQKSTVPASLADLKDPISGFSLPVDPETKTSYEYAKKSVNSFSLCATFALPNTTQQSNVAYPVSGISENWVHDAGHTCFDRSIDPTLYKAMR